MAEEIPADAGASEAGIPQLDFTAFPNQIFWLVVFLFVLFVVVSRIALPRIEAIREARQKGIKDDLKRAEEFLEEAKRLSQETSNRLAGAKAEAESISASARAEIRGMHDKAMSEVSAKIDEMSESATARINEIRLGAAENVREIATEAATEIVARILPDKAGMTDLESAVDARVERTIQ